LIILERQIITSSTVTPPPTGEPCENEGVRDPTTNICNCPSGFDGDRCQTRLGNLSSNQIVY
jgi:hypothetical protein